jgi:hypothetical protein
MAQNKAGKENEGEIKFYLCSRIAQQIEMLRMCFPVSDDAGSLTVH